NGASTSLLECGRWRHPQVYLNVEDGAAPLGSRVSSFPFKLLVISYLLLLGFITFFTLPSLTISLRGLNHLGDCQIMSSMPVVSLAYPLYASIRAIETKSPLDDQQWLTYWVLYSMITLFELTFAKLIEWIPFWSYAKLIVTCWLVIPYFSGAAYVYEQYVRPFYTGKQTINIWYVPRKKDVFSKPDDILVAAEKYIQEHGPDAFQEIIHRSDREVRFRGSSLFSEDDHRY
ncbi:TB2/DP1/HVA22-related protein, partial [Cynara cardunculus var. scolymus]